MTRRLYSPMDSRQRGACTAYAWCKRTRGKKGSRCYAERLRPELRGLAMTSPDKMSKHQLCSQLPYFYKSTGRLRSRYMYKRRQAGARYPYKAYARSIPAWYNPVGLYDRQGNPISRSARSRSRPRRRRSRR